MARLGAGEVRRLLDSNGLRPLKARGQNFVVDPNTVERIARLARVGPGDHVLEIGAGLGALTLALARTGAQVTAVEVDEGLAAVLVGLVPPSVRVVVADALQLDWTAVLRDWAGEWTLVANLPYNIAATLVIDLLERVPALSRMLVMVQREVAERLCAGPGGRDYGAPSVRVAYFAVAKLVGRVSPEVFHPRPRVESALVAIERRVEPAVDPGVASYETIGELVRAGFSGRRKMLRRSLAGLVADRDFAAAGVEPTARAEQLGVVDWGRLAACRGRANPPATQGSPPSPS